jgi:pimeloyl-ACP methyl ester carboxylesterase
MGHGFGPKSEVVLTPRGPSSRITVPSQGRTLPLSPDPTVTPMVFDTSRGGGCIVLPGPFATRDCFRQTAIDVFALIKMITAKKGLADQLDLDASRISFIGQSFGAILGTMVAATEPSIKTLVLNVGGGTVVDIGRLQPPPNLGMEYLIQRNPPVQSDFLAGFAFRGESKSVTTADLEAAKLFEVAEWYNMAGDPLAFASALKGKPVLFQIALGDMEVPNPANSNLIRAASGEKSTWLYRFDLAVQTPGADLPLQPHRFLGDKEMNTSDARRSVAIAAQSQIADFINSGGATISNPNGYLGAPFLSNSGIFEKPKVLPDMLNWPALPAGN